MEPKIRAGKRVLYKQGSNNWQIGEIQEAQANITPLGLFIPIIPREHIGEEEPEVIDWAELNNIFVDAIKLNQYIKDYPEYYMTKEDYIAFIESDEFEKARENAFFTDGDYVYYPVSKYSKSWIEKQPFDYVVRNG